MTSGADIKLLLLAAILLNLWSCSDSIEPSHIVGRTMGTTYSIKYLEGKKTPKITTVNQDVNKLLLEVNRQMSTYIPTSEISIFNKTIKKNTAYKISEDFYKVLSLSMEIASKTSGHFDPTIGPLVNLWGFGPSGKRKVPSAKELSEAKTIVGHEKLSLSKGTISKSIDDLYIDLSASAKGFGVDKVAEHLESLGTENYMVEIGGEVRTKGSKNGQPWKIAIESPHPTDATKPYQKILSLKKHAIATSGNYRNYFEESGKKYGHTIDFRTGKPTGNTLASVTVVHPESCAKADAWATAMMVMGPVHGLEFAEKNGISAYFIYRPAGQKEGSFVEVATTHFNKTLGIQ